MNKELADKKVFIKVNHPGFLWWFLKILHVVGKIYLDEKDWESIQEQIKPYRIIK